MLSKCMIEATGSDVTEVCAELKLCSGIRGGIEGAIHAMSENFTRTSVSQELNGQYF